MLVTSKELKMVSSTGPVTAVHDDNPGRHPLCKGSGIVVADISKVICGNDHDLQHYHIWIYESEVEEVDDAMGC